uniref:Uncharacterized protein n=1 Tax=Oryza punctata TaxID=4537 RepID=A0A0E0KQI9_ORYPU
MRDAIETRRSGPWLGFRLGLSARRRPRDGRISLSLILFVASPWVAAKPSPSRRRDPRRHRRSPTEMERNGSGAPPRLRLEATTEGKPQDYIRPTLMSRMGCSTVGNGALHM